jgi:leucyl-tRNA synthetase
MPRYHPAAIEPKWQAFWEDHQTFAAPRLPGGDKLYALDMFPYPSGDGLHVGHPEGYTATDIVCRAARMQGKSVIHPMGFDSFGLPAEEHAIRTGEHPRVQTEKNIATFRRQLKMLGFSYDWSREIATTQLDYMRWTQWIFLQLFDTWFDEVAQRGRPIAELPIPPDVRAAGEAAVATYRDERRLAYQQEAPVNWCPALGTVLANEEVQDGKSERGQHPVVRMPLRQWMLRITAYAERLLADLEHVDWSPGIKALQRNWIGRSTGAEVDFFIGTRGAAGEDQLESLQSAWKQWETQREKGGEFPRQPGSSALRIYTTRPDTLFGATYMVVAPEHPLVKRLTQPGRETAVEAYCQQAAVKSDLDRTELAKDKSGVFTGSYAINPANGAPLPIWIADYVLISYGSGAIMAVPAHDERDYEFALQYDLPIRAVVDPGDAVDPDQRAAVLGGRQVFTGLGHGVQCGGLDGLPTAEVKTRITQQLRDRGVGQAAVNYKLRDWLFSRQRFWGEPFPLLHELDGDGQRTGRVRAVDQEELPVDLPHLEDFKPHGRPEPPLDKAPDDWLYVERDGKRYKRETNTMPQWAGSCWYYLRFLDPTNQQAVVDPEIERAWMPVDLYIGGAEHAVLHLLYARFWHKVLYDRGVVSTPEPFQKLVNQGMILGANNEKMSKSRGNVINPDEVVREYGADALRLYEMFMGPLEATKPWSMEGVQGVSNFLGRVWRMTIDDHSDQRVLHASVVEEAPDAPTQRMLHRTIKAVTQDIAKLSFNTAIARMMEFTNYFTKLDRRPIECLKSFTLILAPFAPHLAEELWQALGATDSLAYEPWPVYDESLLADETVEMPIQVNGKVRARIEVANDATSQDIQQQALADPRISEIVAGKQVAKVVVIPGRMVNLVIKP